MKVKYILTCKCKWLMMVPCVDVKVLENTWSVSKVSVLIFYLNVYWTHLKLQVITFKV